MSNRTELEKRLLTPALNASMQRLGIRMADEYTNNYNQEAEESENRYRNKQLLREHYASAERESLDSSSTPDDAMGEDPAPSAYRPHPSTSSSSSSSRAIVPRTVASMTSTQAGDLSLFSDERFNCKICDKGWANIVYDKMSPAEQEWHNMIHEPCANLTTFSLLSLIQTALELYNTKISVDKGWPQVSLQDMEMHFRTCIKSSQIETLFQIELGRKRYLEFETQVATGLRMNHCDRNASDMSLRYQSNTLRLLKEREKKAELMQMAKAT